MKDRREHDRRPALEFERDTAEAFDRFIFVPGIYERVDRPERLRVLWGEGKTLGCADLLYEATTSESRTAEGFTPPIEQISLTGEQLRWLHRTLGALLAREDREDSPTLADPESRDPDKLLAALARGRAEMQQRDALHELERMQMGRRIDALRVALEELLRVYGSSVARAVLKADDAAREADHAELVRSAAAYVERKT